jgi:hypothetical protein
MIILLYKAIVISVIVVIGVLLYQMILTGKANRASGFNPDVIDLHREKSRLVVWATIALVLLIEAGVRIKGGSERNLIFWIHTVFAVLYTVSIGLLAFAYDGSRFYHKLLAYFAVGCFMVVAALGIPMLLKRF